MGDKDKNFLGLPEGDDDEGAGTGTGTNSGSGEMSFRPDKDVFYGQTEEEGGGETGGGQTGEIHFRYRDAMSLPPRDDVLSQEEIKRLLIVHKDIHKLYVDKQKSTRKERIALKEGKISYPGQRRGIGYGMGSRSASQYKTHPISFKAQFSGIDKQVIGIANNNEAQTNEALREALENRYQLQHTPKFNPKPRGPMGG